MHTHKRAGAAEDKQVEDPRRAAAEPLPASCLCVCLPPLQANAPLPQDLYADDVGKSGLYLCSDLSRCVTGVTM